MSQEALEEAKHAKEVIFGTALRAFAAEAGAAADAVTIADLLADLEAKYTGISVELGALHGTPDQQRAQVRAGGGMGSWRSLESRELQFPTGMCCDRARPRDFVVRVLSSCSPLRR